MKFLLKILFIILGFLVLQGSNQNLSIENQVMPANYIQNNYQHVVLSSQNLSQNVIIKSQTNDSSNYTFGENGCVIFNQKKYILKSNNPLIARGFIHNLSTNLKSEISIRAP